MRNGRKDEISAPLSSLYSTKGPQWHYGRPLHRARDRIIAGQMVVRVGSRRRHAYASFVMTELDCVCNWKLSQKAATITYPAAVWWMEDFAFQAPYSNGGMDKLQIPRQIRQIHARSEQIPDRFLTDPDRSLSDPARYLPEWEYSWRTSNLDIAYALSCCKYDNPIVRKWSLTILVVPLIPAIQRIHCRWFQSMLTKAASSMVNRRLDNNSSKVGLIMAFRLDQSMTHTTTCTGLLSATQSWSDVFGLAVC
jgi:hypothetical protein